jgi:hypothetical protein
MVELVNKSFLDGITYSLFFEFGITTSSLNASGGEIDSHNFPVSRINAAPPLGKQ